MPADLSNHVALSTTKHKYWGKENRHQVFSTIISHLLLIHFGGCSWSIDFQAIHLEENKLLLASNSNPDTRYFHSTSYISNFPWDTHVCIHPAPPP